MALDNPKPVIFPGSKSQELIVLLHGWGYRWDRLRDLKTTICEQYPDADLLIPRYPASWGSDAWIYRDSEPQRSRLAKGLRWFFGPVRRLYGFSRNFVCWISSKSATKIAVDLNNAIEEAVLARLKKSGAGEPNSGYKRIILVGHSVGALLIRKAYVYGRGQTQDHPDGMNATTKIWPALVDRLVLMSSMDRGWTLDRKPEYMNYILYTFFRLIQRPAQWIGLGKLILASRTGAPFIVNLRIQWVNLSTTDEGYPLTILLVGQYDDMMKEGDHKDLLMALGQFRNLVITSDGNERNKQTGHYDVLRFTPGRRHAPETCEKRKAMFVTAIAAPPDEIRSTIQIRNERRIDVTRVVYLMHGIRDFGNWTDRMAENIHKLCAVEKMPKESVEIINEKYGYFSLLNFLLPRHRREILLKLMDSYTEVFAVYPNARNHFGFIGHSHGTHLLAQAMREYRACRFERVVLTGSVVDRNYEWDEFVAEKRLVGLRNDIATHDWVVGLFPAIHEEVRRVLGKTKGELGSGGLTGFTAHVANKHQKMVNGYHSAALQDINHESIIRYVIQGPEAADRAFPNALRPKDPERNLQWLPRRCWIAWVMVVIVLLFLWLAFIIASSRLASHLAGSALGWPWAIAVPALPWLVAILVPVVIWFLLDTF
jgi:pimeloyl-ACP methyl ester carboxylesterase